MAESIAIAESDWKNLTLIEDRASENAEKQQSQPILENCANAQISS
jgi:hypothetical protein